MSAVRGSRPAARSHRAPRHAARVALGAALLAAAPVAARAQDSLQGPPPRTVVQDDAPLRPGDAIRVRVWREPDLSGEFPVDERGEVAFPKLGPTRVTGISPDSLNRWLLARYGTYLRDPSVEAIALRRVSVTGAVRTPGIYRVDATMTVADAVALAGGAAPEGQRDRVELVRDGRRLATRLRSNARLSESALQSGDQLYVPEKSWLRRNAGLVTGAFTSAAFLLVALLNN